MTLERAVRLNPQGLARKDRPLMSSVQADPGQVFVSCDLSSGEPTVTSHYSKDRNYTDACFNMAGKNPYYTRDGLLKIDNLYLTVLSVLPSGKQLARDLFEADYCGSSFSRRWAANAPYNGAPFQDWVKNQIKPQYAFAKMVTLGLSYGMGPRKLQSASYDAGYTTSLAEARDSYQVYWSTFSSIRAFVARCERSIKSKGYLVNDFGYRLVPDTPHKAFNYLIQSSVSGIMHVVVSSFFHFAPYCTFLLVIHDEVIFSCPEGRVEEARAAMKQAEEALNAMLNWRVRVRVGFAVGGDLYEAK